MAPNGHSQACNRSPNSKLLESIKEQGFYSKKPTLKGKPIDQSFFLILLCRNFFFSRILLEKILVFFSCSFLFYFFLLVSHSTLNPNLSSFHPFPYSLRFEVFLLRFFLHPFRNHNLLFSHTVQFPPRLFSSPSCPNLFFIFFCAPSLLLQFLMLPFLGYH